MFTLSEGLRPRTECVHETVALNSIVDTGIENEMETEFYFSLLSVVITR